METPEDHAKEVGNVNLGKRLVENYISAKGVGGAEWTGPQGDSYFLKIGKRRLEVPLDALGDTGGAATLTAELRGKLDAFLRMSG